ncbi:MAG: S8 family serine peptidase [Candidatus Rokuibacteriota bacterium]
MPEQESATGKERYYWADGQKVALTPSPRFVAVQTPASPTERGAVAARLASSLAAVAAPGGVFELPEYNLTIIALADGNGRTATPRASAAAEAARSYVSAQPDLVLGPSVYEAAGSPAREALIPVGEILVKFKAGVTEDARRRLIEKNNLEVRRTEYPEPGAVLLGTRSDQDPIEMANKLHESDLVEYASPNFARLMPRVRPDDESSLTVAVADAAAGPESVATTIGPPTAEVAMPEAPMPSAAPVERAAPPTDPNYSSQWGLRKIKAPEAFDISMGNAPISIAVIDEGCDLTHEDLVYKLPGYDAVTGSNNPSPLPGDGHGTSCAGITAARANNARGGAGVAPNCGVLPVRIAYGAGGGWVTTDAKIADGLRTAVLRGADVLSNSWGGGAPSTPVTNALVFAQTNGRGGRGCPIAAASGNDDVRGVIYPARLSPSIRGLMAVGASNEWDQRKSKTSLDGETWWGSNYGPELDVVAPGVHIFTTDIMGGAGYGGGNYVSNFNGTSSATPHVAGLMALILSVDPDLRSWEVEDIIKLTADDLGPSGRDEQFGFGRINCRRALEAASRIWYEIGIAVEFLGAGRECFMRANVRMYNPGLNTVRLDSLTLTSHNPAWTAEIDRFEYRPNPGNVLSPRSGHDVRSNRILLRANGNQSSWSYRWALNWTYTYWRPGAPVFPLGAEGAPAAEADGRSVTSRTYRGAGSMARRAAAPAELDRVTPISMPAMAFGNGPAAPAGDVITVDRQTRSITIMIR